MNEFANISDEELAAKCKRNSLEEWLHSSGCLIGLVCGVVAFATVIALRIVGIFPWSWFFAIFVAFLVFPFTAGSTYSFLNNVSRFRCRQALRELEHRYGWRPLAEYVQEATESIGSNELCLILMARALPHGQHWWVNIRIDSGKSAYVETRVGAIKDGDFGSGRNPKECFDAAKGELGIDAAGRMVELAERIQMREINIPSTVRDGIPVFCALIVGATKQASAIKCNLAGIPKEREDDPTVLLIKEVFSAGRALIDVPSVYGSTRWSGEIQIGNV